MRSKYLLKLKWIVLSSILFVGFASAQDVVLTPEMHAILTKTESFGLKKFPISFWNYTSLGQYGKYMTEEEVRSWAEAGFTVPQTSTFDANNITQKEQINHLLDWAQKYGMKLIVTDPRGYAKAGKDGNPDANYADSVSAALRDFGNHPALFGFHVGDEPGAEFKNTFFECMKIHKKITPNLHPFANLLPHYPGAEKWAGAVTWANYLDDYVKKSNADLLSYDCYMQMNPGDFGWWVYFRNLKLYREASLRNGIPFWNTLLSVGHFEYRVPNQDELRWQFYTSLAAGANGIIWYFYYMQQPVENYRMAPVDEFWNKTRMYYDIQHLQNSFHRRYGDLFNKLVSTRVCFFGKSYADEESFSPDALISNITTLNGINSLMIGEYMDIEKRRYVMFVNNSMDKNSQVKVTFPKNAKTYSWDWNGKPYEGNAYGVNRTETEADGRRSHILWLGPGQEAVYRVEL